MSATRKRPNVEHALLAAFGASWGLLALNAVAGPIHQALAARGASPAVHLGVSALLAEIGIGVPLLLVLWLARLDPRAALGLARPRPAPLLWSLVLMVGGGVVLDELMHLAVTSIPWLRSGGLDQVGRSIAGAAPLETAALLLPLGLAPALVEEALCRGLFLRGLLRRFHRDGGWTAIVLSAAFFGALHLDRLHAPVAALMGLLLGVIAVRTGSLWIPVLCHFVNNAVSLLTPALGGPSLPDVLDRGLPWPVVAAALIALFVGLIGLLRTPRASTVLDGDSGIPDPPSPFPPESPATNSSRQGAP